MVGGLIEFGAKIAKPIPVPRLQSLSRGAIIRRFRYTHIVHPIGCHTKAPPLGSWREGLSKI